MIITRDEVKANLGITDSSQDAKIDQFIPVVDAAVRSYTNNNYKQRMHANVVTGSADVKIVPAIYACDGDIIDYSSLCYKYPGYNLSKWLQVGQRMKGTGITEGTYITDVDDDLSTITLSAVATADYNGLVYGTSTVAEGFTFSKMVMDLIDQNNTSVDAGGVQSITEGPTSVTYQKGASDKINGISRGLFAGLKRYV